MNAHLDAPQSQPDLLWHVSGHTSGAALLPNGRWVWVCGHHGLARLPEVADPSLLEGLSCRVCEAERESAVERRRFAELMVRHG